MRFLIALTALLYLSPGAVAQQQTKKTQLTKEQQWHKAQLEQFYETHEVNAMPAVVVNLYTTAAVLPSMKNCADEEAEKLKLEGRRVNEQQVQLKWQTFAEKSNNRFVLERLFYDNTTGRFDPVATMDGYGNNFGKRKYEHTDYNRFPGNTYYRLRQFDAAGNLRFSKTITVDGYPIPLTIRPIPNPSATDNIILELSGIAEDETARLLLTDAKGSLLYRAENISTAQSANVIRINHLRLPDGIYYIKVISGTRVGTATLAIR